MYRELFLQAQAVKKHAHAPYSGFKVGAALLTTDGTMYTGVNVENASFGATICAERAAFCKAISEGESEFEAIAICSSEGTSWPCGICRQFMYEFGPDLKIITGDDEEHLEVCELSELLPKGFVL
ncbi:MAG: cytidine deaminase [Eubacteriaceae bacterium]|nr:cytidine deaminase [Eubacteriaceae bacterium]